LLYAKINKIYSKIQNHVHCTMVHSIFLSASYLDNPRGDSCIFFLAMVLFTVMMGNSTGWKNYSAPFRGGRIHQAGFFYMYLCLSFHPKTVYFHIWGTYTFPFVKKNSTRSVRLRTKFVPHRGNSNS
jgi:hypothetical protein